MRSAVKWILLVCWSCTAYADLAIFDMRKNLAMSNSETVYRDFYINGGSESGLSVGMVLTVQRRLPLYDSYQNRSVGDLNLKVAKIKIIHVQRGLAVGRLHVEFTREASPLLEDPFIMVGDRLDLSSASHDKKADAGAASTSTSSEVAASPGVAPVPVSPPPVPAAAAASTAPKPVPNNVPLPESPPEVPTPESVPASAAPSPTPSVGVEPTAEAQILVNHVLVSANP